MSDDAAYTASLQRMIEALWAGSEIPPGASHLRSVAARIKARSDSILSELVTLRAEHAGCTWRAGQEADNACDEEREACAKLVETADLFWAGQPDRPPGIYLSKIAAAIRARGAKP